ncbi:MAG: amidohydrolase, partial [Gemmatimonadota bacterium]|nr:amidohydrolase [Gemmatimonadota bacterium]
MRHDRWRGVLHVAVLAVAVLLPIRLVAQEAASTDEGGSGLPLEPARWARFTADQGTWISLDISPDGQTIVFDLLGDIYTMPFTGGAATRITEGMPHDMQPRFSPDGSKVVFVSDKSGDDNVWVVNSDGSGLRQITSDRGVSSNFMSPEWTPDGDYIVVSRSRFGGGLEKIWMYHKDGGTGVEMTPANGALRFMGPAFGADERYVWFAQRFGSWQYNSIFPQYQIGVYDRETGTRTTMSSRFGSAIRPALSPDGRWLTYGTRHDSETGLILRELATGEETWLAYPIQRDEQESVANMDALPGYSFTPDSRSVVISYGGRIWNVPLDGTDPTNIPFEVQAEVPVGPEVMFEYPIEDTPTFTVRQIRDIAPSPNGNQVAFTAMDRLYVMDLPDGEPRRVTTGDVGEFYPTWSPDGSSIAYVTWDDREGHIMRVRATGGRAQQLTRMSAYYQELAWSPAGDRIVAKRSDARNLHESIDPFVGDGLGAEFVWVPATGGEATVIGPTNGRSRPHFTDDGDRIYSYGFVPAESGQPPSIALVSTRWDNTDTKRHLAVTWRVPILPAAWEATPNSDIVMPRDFSRDDSQEPNNPHSFASFVMMSPTGDRALAQIGNDFYSVVVPQVGGPVPTVMVSKPDSAAMPTKKLSDIGGEFPAWGADGNTVYWGIGNALVSYDLTNTDEDYTPREQRVAIEAPRDIPTGTVILRGARVITMQGDEIVENADVVIENNRIVSVGANGSGPSGARVVDV